MADDGADLARDACPTWVTRTTTIMGVTQAMWARADDLMLTTAVLAITKAVRPAFLHPPKTPALRRRQEFFCFPGTYLLGFMVGSNPIVYTVQFKVN